MQEQLLGMENSRADPAPYTVSLGTTPMLLHTMIFFVLQLPTQSRHSQALHKVYTRIEIHGRSLLICFCLTGDKFGFITRI